MRLNACVLKVRHGAEVHTHVELEAIAEVGGWVELGATDVHVEARGFAVRLAAYMRYSMQ